RKTTPGRTRRRARRSSPDRFFIHFQCRGTQRKLRPFFAEAAPSTPHRRARFSFHRPPFRRSKLPNSLFPPERGTGTVIVSRTFISSTMLKTLLLSLFLAAGTTFAADSPSDDGWINLFDGKTLDGWKASDEPGTFSVEDGKIVVHGPRSHLYYVG